MTERPALKLWLKRLILQRQSDSCYTCKEPMGEPEFHHIVPFALTQDNSPENLIAMCAACHRRITYDRGVASNQALAKSKRLAKKQAEWEEGQDLKRPGQPRRKKGTIPSRPFRR